MDMRGGIDEERGTVMLIGIGNEFRSDDALGLLVARQVKRAWEKRIRVVEHSGEGMSLMEAWGGAGRVILVDALNSGDLPGSIHRLNAGSSRIPRRFFHYSSHAFGVAEAIELARELDRLPPTTLVYGIDGAVFEAGVGLSDPVLRSIPLLLHMIEEDLRTTGEPRGDGAS